MYGYVYFIYVYLVYLELEKNEEVLEKLIEKAADIWYRN